jgi:hypothetical protein
MIFQYITCGGSIIAFRVGRHQSKTRVLGNMDIYDGKMQVIKHSCEVKYSSLLHSRARHLAQNIVLFILLKLVAPLLALFQDCN